MSVSVLRVTLRDFCEAVKTTLTRTSSNRTAPTKKTWSNDKCNRSSTESWTSERCVTVEPCWKSVLSAEGRRTHDICVCVHVCVHVQMFVKGLCVCVCVLQTVQGRGKTRESLNVTLLSTVTTLATCDVSAHIIIAHWACAEQAPSSPRAAGICTRYTWGWACTDPSGWEMQL